LSSASSYRASALSEKRIADAEVVAFVAIMGIGPGLVTHIDGGSAFYFSDIQRWLAVGLILSRIPMFMTALLGAAPPAAESRSRRVSSRLDAVSVRAIVIAFLLLPIVGSMVSNSLVWPITMARANAATRRALYPPAIAAGIPQGLHGLPYLRDPAILDDGLRRAQNFTVAEALRRLSELPVAVRRNTAVFLPQDQSVFWHSLTRPGACTFQSFVVPALGAIAMVDGMPAVGCKIFRYSGMGSFTPRKEQQTSEDADPSLLCRRAAAAGMGQVLILTFDSTRRANEKLIPCPPKA
jgi:hypothetical protein